MAAYWKELAIPVPDMPHYPFGDRTAMEKLFEKQRTMTTDKQLLKSLFFGQIGATTTRWPSCKTPYAASWPK